MNATIQQVLNITGTALVLGLLLRWGPEAARLIGAVGSESTSFFRAVSLQDLKAPADR